MKYCFSYTLTNDEYLEYLRYMSSHSRQFRGRKVLLMTSIPTLIICTLLFLKVNTGYWMILGIIIILVWLCIVYPKLWDFIMHRCINEALLNTMDISHFEETKVCFTESEMICQKDMKIPYQSIALILPLHKVIVIGSVHTSVLIPYRVFDTQKEAGDFLSFCKVAVKKTNNRIKKV